MLNFNYCFKNYKIKKYVLKTKKSLKYVRTINFGYFFFVEFKN